MPKPNETDAGTQPENQPTPEVAKTDAFGVEEQAPAPAAQADGEGKKEEKKEYAPIPDDHPTIVGLKTQIEDIKREYGGNLSGQRTVIAGLEAKIAELQAGGKATEAAQADEDVLFKDIKWSKDLTKEEREEMTDREIQQMDEIAAMKEAQNKMYAEQKKATKTEQTTKVEDLNASVQSIAKELSKGEDGKDNTELANQIIESAKMFNLEGLTPEQLKERVTAAAKLVPDYKPVKEQAQPKGKTVNNAASDTDPFGTDQIIKEAQAQRGGDYTL